MKKHRGIVGIIILIVIALGFVGFVLWRVYKAEKAKKSETSTEQTEQKERKILNAEGYVRIFSEAQLPNLQQPEERPSILGNKAADDHIYEVAEKRGYQHRKVATAGSLIDADEVTLQPLAAEAWAKLKAAAQEDGISLVVFSGYRSVETQKAIFSNQLAEQAKAKIGRSYTGAEIAAGEADEVLNQILAEYSAPGYSKHHSGYTLDIHDFGAPVDFNKFATTEGYKWISRNNFEKAREFGFIPSYPEGSPPQGPNPEPWEFVYVGLDALKGYELP